MIRKNLKKIDWQLILAFMPFVFTLINICNFRSSAFGGNDNFHVEYQKFMLTVYFAVTLLLPIEIIIFRNKNKILKDGKG